MSSVCSVKRNSPSLKAVLYSFRKMQRQEEVEQSEGLGEEDSSTAIPLFLINVSHQPESSLLEARDFLCLSVRPWSVPHSAHWKFIKMSVLLLHSSCTRGLGN